MKPTFELEGETFDIHHGFLVLSLRERRRIARELYRYAAEHGGTLPSDVRAVAAAVAASLGGLSVADVYEYVATEASKGFPHVVDAERIDVRINYELLFEGPQQREVPGFRSDDLRVIDRELAIGRRPRRIARTLYLAQRVAREHAPALVLDRGELPAGVELSRTVDPARPEEPLIVAGAYAYPVSLAWMLVPPQTVHAFACDIADWMQAHWPEALDLCRDAQAAMPLDRPSMELTAEAFARGLDIGTAALFVFEARVAELEQDA